MSFVRRPRLLLASLALLGLFSACARRDTPVADGIRTQTLLLGNGAEPQDLDPQVITDFNSENIVTALFEGLTVLDERTAQPLPAAALSWNISPDHLVYTFHLRPAARWSNGDPVTADDFVFSAHRMLSPAFAAQYSYILWPMKGARAYNEGKLTDFSHVGIKALNPLTLQITLAQPCPYLLSLTAHPAWLPVDPRVILKFGPIDRVGTPWTRPGNLVGNGPFVLEKWIPNDRIIVAKSATYWDAARVRLQRIVFFPVDSVDVEERMFRAGQLHITASVPDGKIESYRRHDPAVLRLDPFFETFFIRFNVTRPPLNNPLVRQALARAIDRVSLCRDVLHAGQQPAHFLTPPNTAGYTYAGPGIPDDPAAARRLLAEAGYPGGRGFPVLNLRMNTNDKNRKIAEAIQEMWKRELGITVTLSNEEFRSYLNDMTTVNFDLLISRWIGDYMDPSTFLNLFVTRGGNNDTGWSDPAFDRLIAATERTADPTARDAEFQRAETLLLDQAPIAPVYFGTQSYLCQPSVHGWFSAPLGFHLYQNVWLQ